MLWAGVFAATALVEVSVTYAILGEYGMSSWKGSTVVLVGRLISVFIFSMPVLGFILGMLGFLPGTEH